MVELKHFILVLISSSFISPSFADNEDASPKPSPSTLDISSISSPAESPSFISYSPESSPASSPSSGSNDQSQDDGSQNVLPLLFENLPTPSQNPMLKEICSATNHPEECLTSVSLFQTGESDPISVLKMEMQALRKGFEKAIAKATELTEDPSKSDMFKSCLDTCLEIYDTGLYDLDDALSAITSHDIDKLKTFLSATISDIETCEEAFQEEPGSESPMKEYDEELTKLASNNLLIVNKLIR